MIEPRVASVSVAIDRHGITTVSVTRVLAAGKERTVVYSGSDMSLAKEAVFQLSRSQRPVGDGIGLTVNAVTPGFIATDMLATIPDKVLDRIRAQIPVARLGKPEEIARVVGFLAADESAYITGQIWAVNGGLDM